MAYGRRNIIANTFNSQLHLHHPQKEDTAAETSLERLLH